MFAKITMLASVALAAASGGAAHVDAPMSVLLLFASGVSGVIGSLLVRAEETEKALKDIILSIAAAFLFAVGFGAAVGDLALAMMVEWGMNAAYRTELAAHIGGGAITGALMLAALRYALAWLAGGGKGRKS